MVAPAVLAAIAAGGAILNNMSTDARIDEENARIDNAINSLIYNPKDYYTNYQYYNDPLLYDTYLQQDTEYDNINVDPYALSAQQKALDELINLSQAKGLDAIDQQALQEIVDTENRNLKGQQDAIMQNAMQRGVYGSGLEMAQRLQAAQSSANRMNNQDMNVMSQAQQRALEALSNYGNLSSNIRNQSYNEQAQRAAAQDAINQYNINNMTNTNKGNIDLQNQTSRANTDIYNKQQDSNVQSAQDIYGNEERKVALKTGQYNNNISNAKDRENSLNQLIGVGATALGSAFGGSKNG